MLKATEARAHTHTRTHRKRRVLAAADIKQEVAAAAANTATLRKKLSHAGTEGLVLMGVAPCGPVRANTEDLWRWT